MDNYNQQQIQPNRYGEQQQYYSQPQSQQQYYNQPQQQPSYYDESSEETMTVKDWVKTLWLQTIPWVNIVLLLIWAFSGNTKKVKSNYAKGFLIYWLSLFAATLVIVIVVFVIILVAAIAVSG